MRTLARNKYDVDDTLETEFNITHLKRLGSYIKPYRKDLILTIVLLTVSSALGMLTPLILMQIMDVYIPNENITGIVVLSLLIL